MGIEKPEDVDRLIEELNGTGDLDSGNIEDGILKLHDALRRCGADPEDPTSYRAIVTVAAILSSLTPLAWVPVVEELCRVSFRAIRDLGQRGGS